MKAGTYQSVSAKLRKEKRITEEFEVMMNQLTLEEIIMLRLDGMARSMSGKIFGFPIWKNLGYIIEHCMVTFAYLYSESFAEMSSLLGITVPVTATLVKRHRVIGSYDSPIDKTPQGKRLYESYLNDNSKAPNKRGFNSRPSFSKVSRTGKSPRRRTEGGEGAATEGRQEAAP